MADDAIPSIFDRQGIVGFTFMSPGEKFPPIEKGWQEPENAHSFQEAVTHVADGGNIGLIAGNGYGGLDQDDLAAFEGLTLPETTTWETRPGRLGMWLAWSDNIAEILVKQGFKADQAQIHIYDHKQIEGIDEKGREIYKHVGEIKLERTYQVIPPSWKIVDGHKVNYRMLKEVEPAKVSLEWLLSELLRIGLSFSAKSKAAQRETSNHRQDSRAKAQDFLNQAVREGTPGNRNNMGFWLACQLRDLGLSFEEASEYLRVYAESVPAGEHTYTEEDALESLKQAYSQAPRDPPRSDDSRRDDAKSSGISFDAVIKRDDKGVPHYSPTKAARSILESLPLAISDAGKDIYRFDGSIYRPDGARVIDQVLCNAADDLINKHALDETLRRVKNDLLDCPVKFDADPFLFPLENGVIELPTGRFRDAKPDDYLTFRYASRWDAEKADYRHFLWFLCSSLPDKRDVLTVLDVITAIAIRIPLDIIILLIGGGSNGKGILEKVLIDLFTMARATSIELNELKKSRFGPAAILNKDVWIVSEVEGVKDAINALKKISTGELIDSDQKYADRVQGIPHAVPILDTNAAFDFGDDTRGRKRRIIKLDFPYSFGDASWMRPMDKHLKEKLTRPEVLAGITQIIAARAPELIESRRIYRRKTEEEMEEEYIRQRFSLKYFCNDCLSTSWTREDKPAASLRVDDAYNEYKDYCRLFNVPNPAAKAQFGSYIAEKYGVRSTTTTERKGETKTCYRYYPGLYLVNSALAAYAMNKSDYGDYSETTDRLQRWLDENDSCGTVTTETTKNILSQVVEEIERMYAFIGLAGQDVRNITYESYLQSPCSLCSHCSHPSEHNDSVTTGMTTEEEGEMSSSVVGTASEPHTQQDQPIETLRDIGNVGEANETAEAPVEFTEEEDQALAQTIERMKRGRMVITPFALADIVREHYAITPTRCRAWLKIHGWREHGLSGEWHYIDTVDLRDKMTA